MPPDNRRKPEESGPVIGAWMITFSDCMTLLLCFFVMLLTFSSFENVALDRLRGAIPWLTVESIFPNRYTVRDALLQRVRKEVDETRAGSELPTEEEAKSIENPRRPLGVFDEEAYRGRKIIRIPSRKLFYGKGSSLKDEGKWLLDIIASFVTLMPSRIVIGETSRAPSGPGQPSEVAVERAWAIKRYFTLTRKLSDDRFGISAGSSISTTDRDVKPVVEIVLLERGLYK